MIQENISARDFALHAHRGQMAGDILYRHHLEQVVSVLSECHYEKKWQDAGWLFSVLGKTAVTQMELRRTFGEWIFHIAETMTPLGLSIQRNNALIYHGINQFPDAAVIAVADRVVQAEMIKRHSPFPDCKLREILTRDYREFYCHVGHRVKQSLQSKLKKAYTLSQVKDWSS